MKNFLLFFVSLLIFPLSLEAAGYYVIGNNVNGKEWETSSDTQMIKFGDKEYRWTGNFLADGFKIRVVENSLGQGHEYGWSSFNLPPIKPVEFTEVEYEPNHYTFCNVPIKLEYLTYPQYFEPSSQEIRIGGDVYSPTVVLNTEEKTLIVTGIQAWDYESHPVLYLIGLNVNRHMMQLGAEDCRMQYKGNGIYEWEGDVLEGGFRINDGTYGNPDWDFGNGDWPSYIKLGESFKCTTNALLGDVAVNFVFEKSKKVLHPHVILNTNLHTIFINGTYEGEESPEPVVPEEPVGDPEPTPLYMIGSNVNGHNWELAIDDCKFTYLGNGMYEWNGEVLGAGFKINNGNWSTGGYNIGAYRDHEIMSLGEQFSVRGETDDFSHNIIFDGFTEVKNPHVVFNLSEMWLKIEGDTCGEVVWYLYGDFNDYQLDIPFAEIEHNALYKIENIILSEGSLGIASTDFGLSYGYTSPELICEDNLESPIGVVFSDYLIPFSLGGEAYNVIWDKSNGQIIFEKFNSDSPYEPDDEPTPLYMIGSNVNGHNWEQAQEDCKFSYIGSGRYEWHGDVLGTGFKINNGDWSIPRYNIGAGSEAVLKIGEPYHLISEEEDFSVNVNFDGFTEISSPHVIFDLYEMWMFVTGEVSGENIWYLYGDFNDYQLDIPFTEIEPGVLYRVENVVLDEGSFGIANTGFGLSYGNTSPDLICADNLITHIGVVFEGYLIPFSLGGETYTITWNKELEEVTFELYEESIIPDEVALTIAISGGPMLITEAKGGSTVKVGCDFDEFWSISSLKFNGKEMSDLIEENLFITPMLKKASNKIDIIPVFLGEYEIINSTTNRAEWPEVGVAVRLEGNSLIISGASEGDSIVIYNIAGQIIDSTIYSNRMEKINLSQGNIYIVRIGEKAVKVIL